MRRLAKAIGILLALALAGALVLGFWPMTNRWVHAAHPVPLPVAPIPNAEALTAYIQRNRPGIDAFVIHKDGALAFSYGAADVPMALASGRKSVLSLLYGIAWDRGLIDLHKTLKDLRIDESATPLTDTEKRATIENLLESRSGVYLPSGAESPQMKAARPNRGQYSPGENFYYNNWDFNVLGTIFESQTHMTVANALEQWLAQPLGMEDFAPTHVRFDREGETDYPTYRIHMSARDFARIGTLILQNGTWNGKRIVSEAWLTKSFTPSSTFETAGWGFASDAYGYSWWLNTVEDAVIADGWGGQYLYVDRRNKIVFVSRCDIGNSLLGFQWFQRFKQPGDPARLLALRDLALSVYRVP